MPKELDDEREINQTKRKGTNVRTSQQTLYFLLHKQGRMKQRVKWYEGTHTIAFGGMLFFHCFLPFQKRRENAKKCKKWQNEKNTQKN